MPLIKNGMPEMSEALNHQIGSFMATFVEADNPYSKLISESFQTPLDMGEPLKVISSYSYSVSAIGKSFSTCPLFNNL